MPTIDDLLNDDEFLSLPEADQFQIIDEFRAKVRNKPQNTQTLLQNAIRVGQQPANPLQQVFSVPGAANRAAIRANPILGAAGPFSGLAAASGLGGQDAQAAFAQGASQFGDVESFQEQALRQFAPRTSSTAVNFLGGLAPSTFGLAADIATNPAETLLLGIGKTPVGGGKNLAQVVSQSKAGQAVGRFLTKERKVPDLRKPFRARKTEDIQQAFFSEFIPKNQARFRKAKLEAIKTARKTGKGTVPQEEARTVIDAAENLPLSKQARKSVDFLKSAIERRAGKKQTVGAGLEITTPGRDVGVLKFERAKSNLQKSITQSKRINPDDATNAAKEVIGKLDDIIEPRLITPKFQKAKQAYRQFIARKEIIQKSFQPQRVGSGIAGTERGQSTLRNIRKKSSATLDALKQFEKDTGVKFVNKAIGIAKKEARNKFIVDNVRRGIAGAAIAGPIYWFLARPIIDAIESIGIGGSKQE